MGVSEYQTAQKDWAKRIAKYSSMGISQDAYSTIANEDMNRTYTQGSSPMTNAEADVAVFAAANHQQPIQQSPRHSGGILGGLESIASNIMPDIGNVVTQALNPMTYVHEAGELGKGSTWAGIGQAAGDIAQGHIATGLTEAAHNPVLSLVPGMYDLGSMMSAQGRTQLEEHPVSSLLDVLPITKPLAAAAGVNLAEKAVQAGTASQALSDAMDAVPGRGKRILTNKLDKSVSRGLRSADPSPVAALAAGRPVQAALRAADQSLGNKYLGRTALGVKAESAPARGLMPGSVGPAQFAIRSVFKNLSLDAASRNLSALMNQETLGVLHDYSSKLKPSVSKIMENLKGTTDDQTLENTKAFTQKAAVGDIENMNAEERASYDLFKADRNRIMAEAEAAGKGQQVPGLGFYPKDHPTANLWGRRERSAIRVAKRAQAVEDAKGQVRTAQTRQKQAMSSIMQNLPTGKKLRGGIEPYRKAQRQILLNRKNFVEASQRRLEYAQRRHAMAQAVHQNIDHKFEQSKIANPPAHLHPYIIKTFRNKAANLVEKGLLNAAQGFAVSKQFKIATIVSNYSKVMDDLAHSNEKSVFEDYIGKAETKALWEDSIKFALDAAQKGLEPLYFHSLSTDELESISHVHIAKARDMTEEQYMKRVLKLTPSVMNIEASWLTEGLNTMERDAMYRVYQGAIEPTLVQHSQLEPVYRDFARQLQSKGKYKLQDVGELAQTLMERDYTKFDFDGYGIHRPGTRLSGDDLYLPKELDRNLQSFQKGGRTDQKFVSQIYRGGMKVFRTSVLWGPRHFAHVVIGGMMSSLAKDPYIVTKFPEGWDLFKAISNGKPFTGTVGGVTIPKAITAAHFDWRTDVGPKILSYKSGSKLGNLLKDYWEKSGGKVSERLANFESAAQSLYQAAAYAKEIQRGADPMLALEHARDMVVTADEMAPFERVILKQVMPFYSFTRFATKYLVQLPFDHPLRVAMMSRLSNQAIEEWKTGLPQSMMTLFYFGSTAHDGSVVTSDLRNANPFRSIANSFTMAGFLSNLNPAITAPLSAMGFNVLQGTSEMYPQIVYNQTAGDLAVARPKGDIWTGLEQVIPEVGALDMFFGLSDNMRGLKASGDAGSYERELENMFNLPFRISSYNLSKVRGRMAVDAYKGAQGALTQFKKTGDYDNTIGRYSLIPYNGNMIDPQSFKNYWDQLKQSYTGGGDVAAMIPKPPQVTTNVEAQLQNIYGEP